MKKILAIVLVVALTAAVSIAGTMAYLTSTDSDVNVMTLGQAKIEQIEKQRVDMTHQDQQTPAELENWQISALMPAVNTNGGAANDPAVWMPGVASDEAYVNFGDLVNADITGAHWAGVWDSSLKNVKDKFVFVKNTGTVDVYYRTIILYEYDETEAVNSYGQDMLHFNINGNSRFTWSPDSESDPMTVTVNGEVYGVMVATYNIPLKPNTVSRPSLLQVGLDGDATNEIVAQFGDTYDILVLSQAVQTAGFATADAALTAGFGEITEANLQTWFGAMEAPQIVDNAEELAAALASGATEVILSKGSYTMPTTTGEIAIHGDKDTVISGNDATADKVTLSGVTVQSTGAAYTGIKHSEEVVYNNVTVIGNMYLYAENVVFNNCTFDLSNTNDYIWIYGATNVEFNNCTFNTMGKAILVFQDGSKVDQTVKVEGCTFNASAPAYNYDKTIHIAAVSIDGSQGGTYNVILNNNTVDSDFNGLWQDKTSAGNITVTVDGTEVLTATK